jgi:hypothetical protein
MCPYSESRFCTVCYIRTLKHIRGWLDWTYPLKRG